MRGKRKGSFQKEKRKSEDPEQGRTDGEGEGKKKKPFAMGNFRAILKGARGEKKKKKQNHKPIWHTKQGSVGKRGGGGEPQKKNAQISFRKRR